MLSVPVVSESAMPKVEVANATTFPVAPVLFPRMVLAATCASLVSAIPFVARVKVELAPPTNAPIVPPTVNSADGVNVVVATEESALVPLPYKSCDAVNVPAPVPPPATVNVPVIVGGAKVKVFEPSSVILFVMESPLKDVAEEVARTNAPVNAEPYVCLRDVSDDEVAAKTRPLAVLDHCKTYPPVDAAP